LKKFVIKSTAFSLTLVLLIFLKLYLNFGGFRNLIELLRRRQNNILQINKIRYVIKSIEIVCSIIPNISCLIRASVLKTIFNGSDNLKLNIGISTKKNGLFESHAWIILDENIILNDDANIGSYKVILSI